MKGKKSIPKKTRKYQRKKTRRISVKYRWYVLFAILCILTAACFHYREGIRYYVKTAYNKIFAPEIAEDNKVTLQDIRNIEVFKRHDKMLFGFDVSHYQKEIQWHTIDSIYKDFPLDFVFIRATMGADGYDKTFSYNWKKAKSRLLIRGAYHYYRPDENSVLQAQNFINNVHLEPGDFIPVLDIEELPKEQSVANLKVGLKKWLSIVEEHYKAKPIIYSGEHFYNKYLKEDFSDYPVWIANYNFFVENIKEEWHFWQFSDKGSLSGIETKIDLNIFQGSRYDIKKYVLQ
ncbi:glycoside hydrolase family 25 protein [Myroides ceti]|uniref:Glycoside hydrolase family 25 protein n=1 Tax=Paenimyroides ceti TaxID=395087 RepID=A0ABT8CQA9_9FLAO|nr:glycoside hydrolase family 25 protein [Paenimyroides ceti]MDN3705777.1 glycoside hydrolase family 25 protein [Paenimyroides ceti]